MLETDEFLSSNSDGIVMDSTTMTTAYLKMKNLCLNISSEIQADLKIHNQHIFPRYIVCIALIWSFSVSTTMLFHTYVLSFQLIAHQVQYIFRSAETNNFSQKVRFFLKKPLLFLLISSYFHSSIDLASITGTVYSTELCKRLRAFLAAWPPSGPMPHVIELLIATADFERNLDSWSIR